MGQTAAEGSHIAWHAPAECPAQPEVVRQVEQLLGQPLNQPRQHSVAIVGHLQALRNRRYQVDLVFTAAGQRRTRRLQHDDCTQLTEGAALVMAMAIDPERVHSGTGEPVASPGDSTAPSQGTESRTPESRLSVPTTTNEKAQHMQGLARVHWHAALGTMVQGGLLPGADPGFMAEVSALPLEVLRFGFTGSHGLASHVTFEPHSGAQAQFTQWGAGAIGCWQNTQRWHRAVCAQAEFGRIRGAGRNVADPQTRTDNYSAVVAAFESGYDLTHWLRVQVGAGAGLLLARPRYTVQGFGEVYRPAFWLLRGSAVLAVTVP